MARTPAPAGAGSRPRKSPAERAQADYDAAVKSRDVAQRKLTKLQEGVAPAQEAFDAAERRVAYLGQNPDLPAQDASAPPSDPSDAETTSEG
jgi:hypothetical protein